MDDESNFVGTFDPEGNQRKMVDFLEPFEEPDIHHLPNVGNDPSYMYILRRHEWQGEE